MASTFDFMSDPILPSTQQAQNDPHGLIQTPQMYQQVTSQQPRYGMQPPMMDQAPKITIGGFDFSSFQEPKDGESKNKMVINTGTPVNSGLPATKKSSRKKKESNEIEPVKSSDIIRAEGTVEDVSTLSSYFETAGMLNNTMKQIDMVATEIKNELDAVRSNRTLKSKYNVMSNLAGNLSELLEAKISAIKELNNCISKANDMDYKREKDRKSAEAGVNDDKMIMDLYQAFVSNPNINTGQMVQGNMGVLGPTPISSTVSGSSIIRSPADEEKYNQRGVDSAYMNYIANLTPEQNMMLYEQDPNIKQCVIFDAATGNKWFQVMNVATGQPIPNAPTHSNDIFMEDTTLDLKNKIAKNINLNEVYPLIIINDNITNQY